MAAATPECPGARGRRGTGRHVPPADDLTRFWRLPAVLMGMGDYDGNFRYVNPAYQDVLGWSVEDTAAGPRTRRARKWISCSAPKIRIARF